MRMDLAPEALEVVMKKKIPEKTTDRCDKCDFLITGYDPRGGLCCWCGHKDIAEVNYMPLSRSYKQIRPDCPLEDCN